MDIWSAQEEGARALAAEKDFDLGPIDKDGISQRRLDNIDVLVVSNDSAKQDEMLAAAIQAFAARGGKVIGFGAGRRSARWGGVQPCLMCSDGATRAWSCRYPCGRSS